MDAEVIRTVHFVAETADWIAGRIVSAQENGGIFRLSLCGGSTPKPVYAALAQRDEIDWERVLLTFGDERCVAPEDERSNFRMAREALLDPVGMTFANVMRIPGEMDPAEAAARCELHLQKLARLAGEPIFVHDLILLGMGDDGHTASLFPGTEALEEKERWVVANFIPKFDAYRITFTYPLIAAAKEVAFLVNGKAKQKVVEKVLAGNSAFPASRIEAGKGYWLIGE